MRIRPEFLLLLAITLPLVACRDYGDFTVAEREWVDNDELPVLSEMDLTGINLEFAVGSEAHARVVPEVDWPDPVGALMERVKFENGGKLPHDFDLPLEDSCIYVGLEPRYSRFRRVEFQGRTLLFITYLVSLERSEKNEGDVSTGTRFEPRLVVIDESLGMERYDLEIDSLEFWIVQTDSIFGIISTKNRSIHLRKLHFRDNDLVADEPVRLASSGQRAGRMIISAVPGGAFHLAWLTERYAAMPERFVYYAYFNPDGLSEQPASLLSDTATNRFLHLTLNGNQPLVSWADARFISRGFDVTNQSKIMIGSRGANGSGLWPPIVLNIPKDNSENAYSPVFAVRHNDAIAFLWGETSSDSRDKSDKQLGMFDVKDKSLTLAEKPIPHEDIISTALQQQTERQRSMPVAGFTAPDSAECDRWREQLNLKPTRFSIMTPQGVEPITRLDLEKKDDDDDNNRDDNRNDDPYDNRNDNDNRWD